MGNKWRDCIVTYIDVIGTKQSCCQLILRCPETTNTLYILSDFG